MNTYTTSFDGALLKRGFWLYVCRIAYGRRSVLYVGRTGDSSSPHASSPFTRIGQHLGENTRNNSLTSVVRKGMPANTRPVHPPGKKVGCRHLPQNQQPGWMITVQARDRLEAISQEKRFAKVT